jgi:hypothetical protein
MRRNRCGQRGVFQNHTLSIQRCDRLHDPKFEHLPRREWEWTVRAAQITLSTGRCAANCCCVRRCSSTYPEGGPELRELARSRTPTVEWPELEADTGVVVFYSDGRRIPV